MVFGVTMTYIINTIILALAQMLGYYTLSGRDESQKSAREYGSETVIRAWKTRRATKAWPPKRPAIKASMWDYDGL